MIGTNNLYKDIINVLINIFKNEKLKKFVIKNEEFYEHVFKIVNDLLVLEQDFNETFNDIRYSRVFVQVLANLTNKEIKMIKEDNLSIQTINDNINFIKTYILNVYQIDKIVMSEENNINVNDIEKLGEISLQLKSELEEKPEIQAVSVEQNNQMPAIPQNLKDLPNNFQNVLNFPQSPLVDKTFYPYTSKPKAIPILRQVIGFSFAILTGLAIILAIYGFITKIDITEAINKSGFIRFLDISSYNSGIFPSMIQIGILFLMAYFFLKPVPMIRERYRIQPLWLIIAIIILLFYAIFDSIALFSKDSFNHMINSKYKDDLSLEQRETIFDTFWNDKNFQIFRYLKIAFAMLAVIPAIIIFYTVVINPRIDRQKVFRAQQEYQKAITAAMRGEKYQMNPNLFDDDLKKEIAESEKRDNNT